MRDPSDDGMDATLTELARVEEAGGQAGRLFHLLHLELIRPGKGVWFQVQPEGKTDKIPPWPKGDEEDPLEEAFGHAADQIQLLTRKEIDELARGGNPTGVAAKPKPGDLTKPGKIYPSDWRDHYPSFDKVIRAETYHFWDGLWVRLAPRPTQCDQLWRLHFHHEEKVAACAGVNYTKVYRATLLRAIAEAFRTCREHVPDCPDARVWMQSAWWGCFPPVPPFGGFPGQPVPLVNVQIDLMVVCIAN